MVGNSENNCLFINYYGTLKKKKKKKEVQKKLGSISGTNMTALFDYPFPCK